uniref:Uncharacterized protein n=1 Tax=Amphimedon queenslandica TaxID=400682 RepID=A0A1X7TKV3_AMPQE
MAIQKVQTTERNTALIVSARGGHYEIVKVLLDNGADPNLDQELFYFNSPLIEAAAKGHYQVVELLLTKGADPNFTSKYTGTPLTVAAKKDIIL